MNQVIESIKTELQARQKKNPQFSLRAFARRLEVSPAQLSQIISGKRPVTLKFIKKVSKKLDYSPREAKALIEMYLLDRGLKQDGPEVARIQLAEDQFRLISDWFHFAILSLTHVKGAKSDPRWIANQLGISVSEASEAVSRLLRMGLLSLSPEFKQTSHRVVATSVTPSEAIRKYHKQNLVLAAEKLESVPNELRNFQSVNIPIQLSQLDKYKKIIDEFLDLASEAANHKNADQIYNLNVQFFPITQLKESP